MKADIRVLAIASLAVLALALPSLPASACKADACGQSMAPTSLSQLNGGNNNNNNGNTPPTSQQFQQCQTYAKDSMTGTDLYAALQALPRQQQYAFFETVMGMGGGENDLQQQVQNNMFGGDLTAYNTWVNDNGYGTNGYVNNITFNPATGVLMQNGSQVGSVGGWTCPYYP